MLRWAKSCPVWSPAPTIGNLGQGRKFESLCFIMCLCALPGQAIDQGTNRMKIDTQLTPIAYWFDPKIHLNCTIDYSFFTQCADFATIPCCHWICYCYLIQFGHYLDYEEKWACCILWDTWLWEMRDNRMGDRLCQLNYSYWHCFWNSD